MNRRSREQGVVRTAARTRIGAYCFLLCALAVGACENGIKPTATITAADTADQVLVTMSHYVTQAGVQRAHVRADTAYFYSPVQTAELRKVHITFYDPRGAETSTLTAREGTYHWRSGDMEARGNVLVVRTDGATLRTEVLRYSQVRNQVSSDKPFVFDEPNRHIAGEGFTSDPDFKVVTAIRPKGTGGKFTLPNQ
ncbi:MAG: LPS export ABC transporter periplasmic protein LptC [Gemmatimonadetes bacterium 13_1_40CM_3_69_22]|nr:MAG: LPS export ABC transporter periplasmic protein LptC [Gemmatimonadetes bacterium 13_2_20CM_69_8]OLD05884.1 MAG: LPS export ABC transporter periplasmic protein LptC [Gemmatimonadetes bacterium 13_1_40CM_3_69_22]PYO15053.1 MAG: LPS export ABC transporter periplasmic protein LptC [Gemmatimonadota bacterium]